AHEHPRIGMIAKRGLISLPPCVYETHVRRGDEDLGDLQGMLTGKFLARSTRPAASHFRGLSVRYHSYLRCSQRNHAV
ncbi:MAG: hypothetical protein ACREQ3_08690, partial [Candidatus Binatia bacterium]